MKRAPKTAAISEFVEQFSRRISSAAPNRELTRFQWRALRYYGRAYKEARTIQGFAKAHAISVGRATQIVRQLRRKRLLSCNSRSLELAAGIKVTAAGAKVLRRDPQRLIHAALRGLSASERRALITSLKRASAALARSTKRTTHILLAAASLFSLAQGKEPPSHDALTRSACDFVFRLS